MYGFYEWLSCTEQHKVVRGIDQHRNWLAQSQVERSLFSQILFQLNLQTCTIDLESLKNNSANICFLEAETVRHTWFHDIKIQLKDSVGYKMLLFVQQNVYQHHLWYSEEINYSEYRHW